ncbi:MAG: hypothetical protein NTV51_24030 [Verrucomicrobia bacterium]|nr:hypothetical protein [Verrucomicrobiota bacterium]
MFAIAGGLAAPMSGELRPVLRQVDGGDRGIRRFALSLDVPETTRKLDLVVRLRWRESDTADWLQAPPISLEASPVTWKATLGRFLKELPGACVPGSDRVMALFLRAGLPVNEGTDATQVWFADASADLDPAIPRRVTIIFKAGLDGQPEVAPGGRAGEVKVFVDTNLMAQLDRDPVAQESLERALQTARAFATPAL